MQEAALDSMYVRLLGGRVDLFVVELECGDDGAPQLFSNGCS